LTASGARGGGLAAQTRQLSLELQLDIPNFPRQPQPVAAGKGEEGVLVFVSLVCSALASLVQQSSRLRAMEMLLVFAYHLPDAHKLDRILPYLCSMLTDEQALVRAAALRSVTQLLAMVNEVGRRAPFAAPCVRSRLTLRPCAGPRWRRHAQATFGSAELFPEYLLPLLSKMADDPEVLVQTTYASCIGSLSESAFRLLQSAFPPPADDVGAATAAAAEDAAGAAGPDAATPAEGYDAALDRLQALMLGEARNLLASQDTVINRTVLADIVNLCTYCGPRNVDELLQHLITYLNKSDWQLRSVAS